MIVTEGHSTTIELKKIFLFKTNNHMFIECLFSEGFGVRIVGDEDDDDDDDDDTDEQSFSRSLSCCCCCW